MVNRNFCYVFLVLVLLSFVVPTVFSLETNITYVNDKQVKIRVLWSEDISESLADLYGSNPQCAISGYTSDDCSSDQNLLCEQNLTNTKEFFYSAKTELSDCQYTFRVIASDVVGNALIDYIYINFTLDSTSPTVLSGYPNYYITGNGVNAKQVRFEIKFDELLLTKPSVIYNDTGLNASYQSVQNETYVYELSIDNTKSEQVLLVTAFDVAGNVYNQTLKLFITAPRPPVINPGNGAVIKSTFNRLTFFFYENISKDTMTILLDGQNITVALQDPDPLGPSAQYLKGRVYYYPLNKDLLCNKIGNIYDCVDIPHVIEVSAVDSKGSKMGPILSTFTVNDLTGIDYPDVFRPLYVNQDYLISDQPNTPIIVQWTGSSPNFGESITVDVILPDSTVKSLTKTVTLTSPSLYYEFEAGNFSFGEGLNVLVLNAFDFNSFGKIVNFTYPFIMNAVPPNITAITPPVKLGGKAVKEVLEFSTNEQSRCRFDDQKSSLSPSQAFFFMTEMDSAQLSNGYFHYEALPASDSSIPLIYDYYAVCCDYFGLCSDFDHGHFNFTVDLYKPIITLIEPSSSINYYFEFHVVTNEITQCKYIDTANKTIPDSEDSSYPSFFTNQMIDFDTSSPNPYMLDHYAVVDYKSKGPGSYSFYIECRDEAGNFARNRQTLPNIYIAKTKNITISTEAPLLLSNLTLNGTTSDTSGLLSFTSNRVASCYFKFGFCTDDYYLFGDASVGAAGAGLNGPKQFRQYLIGTNVTSSSDTICLPQYATGKLPEGTYMYDLFCTTEGKQESFGTLAQYTFPVVGFGDTFWTFAQQISFTIDTTAPRGFTFKILNGKDLNGSVILYTLDKIKVQLGLLANSSDAVSFYYGVSSDATSYSLDMQPNVVNWTAVNSTYVEFNGLTLKDLSTYFVHVIATDAAGNRMKRSEFSQPLYVDVSQAPSCSDGILSTELSESDIDCGGSCINEGKYCSLNASCSKNSDCATNNCGYGNGSLVRVCLEAIDLCVNNQKDIGETSTDCGGPTCPACTLDETCFEDGDCQSNICEDNTCVAERSSCNSNGICDSSETLVTCPSDCSGSTTKPPADKGDTLPTDPTESSSGILEIMLIVFALLVFVAGGTFVVYTKYFAKPKTESSRAASLASETAVPRQFSSSVQSPVPETKVASKKYTKKRDLSIMGAFGEKTGEDIPLKEIKKETAKAEAARGAKETSSSLTKLKEKDDLDLLAGDDLSALDALSSDEDDLSKLDALASKDDKGLDALAKIGDDDAFSALSDLVGEDAAAKLDDLEMTKSKKKKADLLHTLASMQSTDKMQNKNIFQQVLLYLVKSGKLNKSELSKVLLELSNNNIIEKKDMMDVLYNIEKELK